MLTRLVLGLFVAFLAFVLMRIILRNSKLSVKQFFRIYFLTLFGIALIYLGITGFFNPVIALLAVMAPFLMRFVTWVPRGLQLFSLFKNVRQFTSEHSTDDEKSSEIKTKYLHMVLYHDSGNMDGEVLQGKYQGTMLERLDLEQILELRRECAHDPDSRNLVEAFLDRKYNNWRDKTENTSYTDDLINSSLNESQALEILGLKQNATRDQVVHAHRKLMQKLHPDRGGSTYLAAKVNEAKSILLEKRRK